LHKKSEYTTITLFYKAYSIACIYEIITIQKGIILMSNVILATEKLREELETLISIKGLNHKDVLKLSQRLDKYILKHYSEKY